MKQKALMTADMKLALVPVEPDDGMIEAGQDKIDELRRDGMMIAAADIYAAMLAASPPPAGDGWRPRVKPLEWRHNGSNYYAYCHVTGLQYRALNNREQRDVDAQRASSILSALALPTPPANGGGNG